MLPMRADLQELMITDGEIKKIVSKFSNLDAETYDYIIIQQLSQ